ncbi:MAG: hypothetical protein DLM67_25990 [Candidatus Nephthysia bennettiae]|nr:MAG: hypothetical protein DLM67_25990 [Candidatus Dormibacteraeota bacterium]
MSVSSIRLRPEQARWLAELIFDGNRELEDAARAAGSFRPEFRLSDSDVVRIALDRLRGAGGWPELRKELLEEARRVRPGRPAKARG